MYVALLEYKKNTQTKKLNCCVNFVPTTRQNKVWGAQKYVRESPQESKVNQVGEEANSHHQHWEPLKNIEAQQHTCGKLQKTTKPSL